MSVSISSISLFYLISKNSKLQIDNIYFTDESNMITIILNDFVKGLYSYERKKAWSFIVKRADDGAHFRSGIILLPPMIHQTAGDYAIFAWLLMLGIGFFICLGFCQIKRRVSE